VQKEKETKTQAGSVEESKDPPSPPTKEELAFLKDDELPKSVSVLCRIRLMNSSERLHWLHRVKAYKLPRPDIIAVGAGKKTKNFKIPTILREETKQKEAFEPVRRFIDDMFKGCNTSVLAYGSTGSGKTFTISGGAKKTEGIIQQAVEEIRNKLKLANEKSLFNPKLSCYMV